MTSTDIQHINIADTKAMVTPHGQPLRHVVGGASSHLYAVDMPPLHVAHVHWHATTDTILIFESGHGMTLQGEQLQPIVHRPRDVLFVPAGHLHVGINLSPTEPFVVLEFRGDAPHDLDVHLLEWAQPKVEDLARRAQDAFAAGQDPAEVVLRSAA